MDRTVAIGIQDFEKGRDDLFERICVLPSRKYDSLSRMFMCSMIF